MVLLCWEQFKETQLFVLLKIQMCVPSSLPEPAHCRVREEIAVTDQSVGGGGEEYLREDLHKGTSRGKVGDWKWQSFFNFL